MGEFELPFVPEIAARPLVEELLTKDSALRKRVYKLIETLVSITDIRDQNHARRVLDSFWRNEGLPFLAWIHEIAQDVPDPVPFNHTQASIRNVYKNMLARLGPNHQRPTWSEHDVERKVVR